MSFLSGATIGVLTPALDLPVRPRLFMEFNLSFPHSTESQFARLGNPGPLAFPVSNGSPLPAPVGEGVLQGIGTQITAVHQGPQIHAGFGGSIEFTMRGDQILRIKPAVQYSRTILDVTGQTLRAVRLNNNAGNNQSLADFRFILLQDERTEVYHAIGPSVEIEYDPALQWGPVRFSLYARGHASYFLTSAKTQMQQCNVAGGQPNECARWKYTQDPWAYRATAGIRLSWVPKRFW